MKKIILLFFAIFLFSGCYESKFPLSSSKTSPIDEKIIGYWVTISKEGKKNAYMGIYQFNKNEYMINWNEIKSSFLSGFITKINNENFMNVKYIQPIKSKNQNKTENIIPYFFFKYSIKDDILSIKLLRDSGILKKKQFNSSKEFYRFMKNNMNNEKLYNESLKFVRTTKFNLKVVP